MRRWSIALVASSVLIMASACSAPAANESGAAEEAIQKVKVAEVARVEIGQPLKVDATLLPSAQVSVLAEVGGRVQSLPLQVGEAVETGQLLMKLDDADYRFGLQQAQLAREKVLLQLDQLKVQLRSGEESTELDMLKVGLKEADLSIEQANRNLAKTSIVSPISGVLTDLNNLTAGQQVNAGQQVASIEQLDPLHVQASVTEQDLLMLQDRPEMNVFIPVLDQMFSATQLYTSPSGSAGGQGFSVKLSIPNPEGKLRPGMSAHLILNDELAKPVVGVPVAAVLNEDGRDFVFTIENGKAVRKDVQIGRQTKEYIEVTDGLEEGETIVIVGQSLLEDGEQVDVVE